MDSSSTLEELHFAVQNAVNFENDHMYEFFVALTDSSRIRIIFDDENEGIYDTTLKDLFPLQKKRKLFYMFDYGDSWYFRISKSRKKETEPVAEIEYPRLIDERGTKPIQYSYSEE